VASLGVNATFVLAGIGSLSEAHVRHAGARDERALIERPGYPDARGMIAADCATHVHAGLTKASGEVFGGHLAYGCVVRTAE
jgi:predicted DNA-binding protein with PD1-like motif